VLVLRIAGRIQRVYVSSTLMAAAMLLLVVAASLAGEYGSPLGIVLYLLPIAPASTIGGLAARRFVGTRWTEMLLSSLLAAIKFSVGLLLLVPSLSPFSLDIYPGVIRYNAIALSAVTFAAVSGVFALPLVSPKVFSEYAPMFSRRRVLTAGIALVTVVSVGEALTGTFTGIRTLGGGLVIALVLTITALAATAQGKQDMGVYTGSLGAVVSIGSIAVWFCRGLHWFP